MADGVPGVAGEMTIDGVAGTAAPVRFEFTGPGGARGGLPAGRHRVALLRGRTP